MVFLFKKYLSKKCRGGGHHNCLLLNNKFSLKYFITFLFLLPNFIFAAGGLDKAEALLDTVASWLNALSVVSVTIAILLVGYKVAFGKQTIPECVPIIIGGILIASAAQIAKLLLG